MSECRCPSRVHLWSCPLADIGGEIALLRAVSGLDRSPFTLVVGASVHDDASLRTRIQDAVGSDVWTRTPDGRYAVVVT